MSGKIGEHTETHLLNVAKSVVEKKTKDSVILDIQAEARIPKFDSKGRFYCPLMQCQKCAIWMSNSK
jgi:hypothetical protein